MEKNQNKLPDEVAKEFEIKNGYPFKFAHRRFGTLDLNNINIDQARNIAEDPNTGLIKLASQPKVEKVADKSEESQDKKGTK